MKVFKHMNEQELTLALEQAGEPLVVFLHTPLCGTCKAARRMLEVAAHLLPPGLLIAEANVNMLPGIVGQYRISSVPALLIAGADRTLEPEIYYSMGSVEQMLEYIRRVTS
ncbi:thioredoxin family protein [Paenibacillus sp. FSL R7-0331]|uniref:thioredoxin family protein n=1 Tax=Paenibacillus sp. FSL R7-0331 TaxID=1536773 RepID=UPI0004F81A66|nr:thioredoxin family protein [Paenibacillus sp. FSL R7-0331]AIQ53079.1 thiol-disulfide isomerase [Paenibacillus sp. FSL R7-0331]